MRTSEVFSLPKQLLLLVVMLVTLAIGACSLRSPFGPSLPVAPITHGQVVDAPASNTINDLIAQKASASAQGNHKLSSALSGALFDTNNAANDTNLNWILMVGVLVIGCGVALAYFGLKSIGLGLALGGVALIGASMLVESILPYMQWVALGVLVTAGISTFYWLHLHVNALKAKTLSNGVSSDPHVQALLDKIKSDAVKVKTDVSGQVTKVESDVTKVTEKI